MGQVGGVRWSESSEVTPGSLDCILGITGCHDQVVCGNQGEEAGLEERREKGVPGGEQSWAPVGERLTCLGESEECGLAGVEGSSCGGEEDGRKGRIRGPGHPLTLPTCCPCSGILGCGQGAVNPHPEHGPSTWCIALNDLLLSWSRKFASVPVILNRASWLSLEKPHCPASPPQLHPECPPLSCSRVSCPRARMQL